MTPEHRNREGHPDQTPDWLRTANVEALSLRLFRREEAEDAYPLWADGGVGETSGTDAGLAPCAHRLAVLPDKVWKIRTEALATRELISWLRERLPQQGQDQLYAVLLSYDAGRNLESIPATAKEDPALPEVVLARYPAWLESPGANGPWALRGGEPEAREALLAWFSQDPSPPDCEEVELHLQSTMGPETHERAVRDVLEGIRAGDLYQANVARRLECPMDPHHTPELYRRLRENTPPAFGALWQLSGDVWLASVSPERLVTWEPETRIARSYPIKGTRPRSGDPAEDLRLAEELMADPKERAEHVMIVDLV
ncbi:MAG: chorismate-binding protein, partial [Myxococcota bacterium]|nr:chorismate-binding protein [Myxococcota bacterium]